MLRLAPLPLKLANLRAATAVCQKSQLMCVKLWNLHLYGEMDKIVFLCVTSGIFTVCKICGPWCIAEIHPYSVSIYSKKCFALTLSVIARIK